MRDEKVAPLAEAVRRLTSLPAKNLGLRDRGMLKPGWPPTVVFDPATIADHATFEKPMQYATGVRDVFVNGVRSSRTASLLERNRADSSKERAGPGGPAAERAATGAHLLINFEVGLDDDSNVGASFGRGQGGDRASMRQRNLPSEASDPHPAALSRIKGQEEHILAARFGNATAIVADLDFAVSMRISAQRQGDDWIFDVLGRPNAVPEKVQDCLRKQLWVRIRLIVSGWTKISNSIGRSPAVVRAS